MSEDNFVSSEYLQSLDIPGRPHVELPEAEEDNSKNNGGDHDPRTDGEHHRHAAGHHEEDLTEEQSLQLATTHATMTYRDNVKKCGR